ncbi:hypothetical protein EJV46_00900 [Roseococcus sp. SYP-B2431]|uniref:hypothetical protein n=1 Tax=Roseococcus sp. SYP-B2431 TaxID=2496640 RepID=UPI00103BFCF6|nr:hypothetical protein [Roseococcus sp. SYP-B2431]TCI00852.1 hypothetical protein EJV46_00900 [Roseococcus sp. SYP-B2431]
MAESQVPYSNLPHQIAAIRASLSEPRFSTYLAKGGGDEGYAIALYLYNARVAKAFMYPLGVVEVTLRNAIDALLVAQHGPAWQLEPSFRDSVLMPDGLSALDTAIRRAGVQPTRDHVVAELTFDFWSNLLRPEYGSLWRTSLNVVFPNLVRGTTRHQIQAKAREINRFRNRVAHHEPVLDLNITDIHAKIVELAGLRCAETAAWLRHHSTVGIVTRTRPRGAAAGFTSVETRLATDFVTVTETTTLDAVAHQFDRKNQVAVCLDDRGSPVAAFGALELTQYISKVAKPNGGLVALDEHTVKSLLEAYGRRWIAISASDPFSNAAEHLLKGMEFVVGLDANGDIAGVIPRALRRY